MRCRRWPITMALVVAVAGSAWPVIAQAGAGSTGEAIEHDFESTAHGVTRSVEDTWITALAKLALFDDERVRSSRISVETHRGVVMLRGKVDSAGAKATAGEIALKVTGVKEVKNELQVVAPGDRDLVDQRDQELERAVEEALTTDPRLRAADIDVRVDAAVVTLTGHARDVALAARASELAWRVTGIRAVNNDIALD